MTPTRPPGVRWTQQAIIAAILSWYDVTGRAPAAKDWLSAGEQHPSSQTVRNAFGDWRDAIVEAALAADTRAVGLRRSLATKHLTRVPTRRPGVRWTQEAIVEAILAWHESRGQVPTAKDWSLASERYPSSQTVRRVFGDWRVAIEQAALARDPRAESMRRSLAARELPRVPTRRAGVRWTPELIAYAIRIWSKHHDGPPSIQDWQYAGEENPCHGTVVRVFGTWQAALDYAEAVSLGVPRSEWSCSDCGELLRHQTVDGLCGFCRAGVAA